MRTVAELLSRPDIDAVIVTTANIGHKDATLAAAAAGKHVLCEKPLATTVADGRAMIEACAAAGVFLGTAFPCRYLPAVGARQGTGGSGQARQDPGDLRDEPGLHAGRLVHR